MEGFFPKSCNFPSSLKLEGRKWHTFCGKILFIGNPFGECLKVLLTWRFHLYLGVPDLLSFNLFLIGKFPLKLEFFPLNIFRFSMNFLKKSSKIKKIVENLKIVTNQKNWEQSSKISLPRKNLQQLMKLSMILKILSTSNT